MAGRPTSYHRRSRAHDKMSRTPNMSSIRKLPGTLLLPAFLVVYTMFFLGTVDGRLEGDDHFALAHGYALLAGDRLNVDFFDPGVPLQTVLSYLGQQVSGSRTIAEVVIALVIRLIGLASLY